MGQAEVLELLQLNKKWFKVKEIAEQIQTATAHTIGTTVAKLTKQGYIKQRKTMCGRSHCYEYKINETENQIRGKKARIKGSQFEKEVRKFFEEEGGIVFKNPNNLIDGKYTGAKFKFNPITKRPMMLSSGFPDLLCVANIQSGGLWYFVECKVNGYLTQEEKEKVKWIKDNLKLKVFVAHKKKGKLEVKEI